MKAKHAFDRLVAALLLLWLVPILLLIALAVKTSSPGPVLFRQRRVGRGGAQFDLLKFRSMRVAGPDDTFVPLDGRAPGGVEGEDRRTRVGRWLRRSTLDELPQLWNIVRGEMSLVGPRPERPQYASLFLQRVPGYAARHQVHPGLTGLAQVRGLRGQSSIDERTGADIEYIENWSLRLDLRILLLTPFAVAAAGSEL